VHKPSPPATVVKAGSPRRKYTPEDVLDRIRARDTILAQRLDEFLDTAEERYKLFVDTGTGNTALSIILRSEPGDGALNFGAFRSDLTFHNYDIAKNPQDHQPYLPGETYLRTLASLLPDATVYKPEDGNSFYWTVKKKNGNPISIAEILDKQEEFLNLIHDTRDKIATALQASPNGTAFLRQTH
jgi:hypothetical protein